MLPQNLKTLVRSYYEIRAIRATSELSPTIRRNIVAGIISLALHKTLENPILLAGCKVSFHADKQLRFLFHEIFIQRSYFFRTTETRPLIIDCGSNIGLSLLFFKMLYPEARIIAFEPDPDTFKILQQNVQQNSLTDVTLKCCALTDVEGTIEFYRSEDEKGSLLMSILPERMSGAKIDVPSRLLSSFIDQDVDLLKMDIEGAEQRVLRELAASGKLRRVKRLHLEYHHHIFPDVDNLSETLALLEEQGFGYQMQAGCRNWPSETDFQDISLYCYRKMQ